MDKKIVIFIIMVIFTMFSIGCEKSVTDKTCENMNCGLDNGISCGVCKDGFVCNDNSCEEVDPCGDISCNDNEHCFEGACICDENYYLKDNSCKLICENMNCGLDNGISCGVCNDSFVCNSSNNCEKNLCKNVICGNNEHCSEGVCTCDENYYLKDNSCKLICENMNCGTENGISCGVCEDGFVCNLRLNSCKLICENMNCGLDNGISCGVCKDGFVCNDNSCEEVDPCEYISCNDNEHCFEGACICDENYYLKDNSCKLICENMNCGTDNGISCGVCNDNENCNGFNNCEEINLCEGINCNSNEHCNEGVCICNNGYYKFNEVCVDSSCETEIPRDEVDSYLRGQQYILNPIWSANYSITDNISTNNYNEVSSYENIELLYYFLKNNITGTAEVNRLYNNHSDHLVSLVRDEGGYSFEKVLGYVFNNLNKAPYTKNISRVYNPQLGDHRLINSSSTYLDTENLESLNKFSYERYQNNAIKCINGDEIRVCSNKRAGGSLWELWWNGVNFIDVYDYGREIQSSMGQLGNTIALPTEGGDNANAEIRNENLWHGSPIAKFVNDQTNKKQITRAIPLEWMYDEFGGDSDHPVIYYDWLFGKNLKLDDNNIDLGADFNYLKANIITYETVMQLPRQLGGSQWTPAIEIPTGYASNQFTRFFTINATVADLNDALNEIDDNDFQINEPHNHFQYSTDAGGVVIAHNNLDYAIGIYSKRTQENHSGYVYFALFKFPSTSKWSAGYKGILNCGDNIFKTYIIVGTLNDVRVAMRRLYLMGY